MIELSQRMSFYGVHTLDRPGQPDADGSRRTHGHDYQATIVLRGEPDPVSGMLVDIGSLKAAFDAVRIDIEGVDTREVPGLGAGTIENLAAWIWARLKPSWPQLHCVEVGREAHGDLARYWG